MDHSPTARALGQTRTNSSYSYESHLLMIRAFAIPHHKKLEVSVGDGACMRQIVEKVIFVTIV